MHNNFSAYNPWVLAEASSKNGRGLVANRTGRKFGLMHRASRLC